MIREFTSLEEIKALPGYVARINEGKYALAKPLGYYRFEKKIHCALATCNQPHGFGYVVVATSGAVVAVGNVCGAALFGDEFIEAAKSMAAAAAHQMLLREIDEKLRSLPEYKQKVETLLNHRRGAR